MLKKKIKIILLALLILSVIAILLIESLSITFVHRSIEYIDDYNEFYLYKKKYIPSTLFDFGIGRVGSGYKIWLLPKQKEKLLAKIKEDVEEELKDIILNNSDIFDSYKVNDDFKKIYLYHYKDVDKFKVNPELAERYYAISEKQLHKILLKMELYYEISRGDGKSARPHDTSIDIVPVELPKGGIDKNACCFVVGNLHSCLSHSVGKCAVKENGKIQGNMSLLYAERCFIAHVLNAVRMMIYSSNFT